MPVSIAEYLGQRTDVDFPEIKPVSPETAANAICPFTSIACSKVSGRKRYPPVCSVRDQGKIFPVCPDRLLPSRMRIVSPASAELLTEIGKILFPEAMPTEIGYRKGVGIRTEQGEGDLKTVHVDYSIVSRAKQGPSPSRVLVDIQGGGETSNTGGLSRLVKNWQDSDPPYNSILRSSVGQVGTIPNNAWKRRLEQLMRKSLLARQSGGAYCLAMGEVLYDYVINQLRVEGSYRPGYELVFVEITEVGPVTAGPVQFQANRATYLKFDEFMQALTTAPRTRKDSSVFEGTYSTATGDLFDISS